MNKIPEYKVCAAAAALALAPPAWAAGLEPAELIAAQHRRRELPMASASPTPSLMTGQE
jgi:hypothetical protein